MKQFFRFLKILSFFLIVIGLVSLFSFFKIVLADTTLTLRPTADGGDDSADWKNTAGTKCNSTDCYLGVDESSGASCTNSDGNTSYVKSAGLTSQTFDIDESSIPDDSTVTNIAITICYKEQDSGGTFQTRQCHNGSCSNSGTNISTSASYQETTQNISVNYTKTSSSDIEMGMMATAANVRISQVSTVITYTLPGGPPPPPGEEPPKTFGPVIRRVHFFGQAYPESKIEVLRKRARENSYIQQEGDYSKVDPLDGTFLFYYIGLIAEDYLFALQVYDKDGRSTGILAFDIPLYGELVEIKDILVPPTIGFEKSLVSKGGTIRVMGYAAPKYNVELEIDGSKYEDIYAGRWGFWSLDINTTDLSYDEHSARVRQISADGKESSFSPTRIFKISELTVPKADFNGDNQVNITDWSIFLFRWGSEDQTLRSKIDMDDNGKISIADFSIFLKSMEI